MVNDKKCAVCGRDLGLYSRKNKRFCGSKCKTAGWRKIHAPKRPEELQILEEPRKNPQELQGIEVKNEMPKL